MVLGLRTKNRKCPSVHVDYLIHIDEIKPWPPSQSLRTLRGVVIQWEHGDRLSGSTDHAVPSLLTTSGVGDGRIEFDESFRLPVTLLRQIPIKVGDGDSFQKNCIEFNMYEPRRDKTMKGQLLGTAVVDLADYGVVKEILSINSPVNCTRSYRNTAQPLLYLKIEPVERSQSRSLSRDNLTREPSMDRSVGGSVSSLMSEECADEDEIASFSDGDISSRSSVVVSSSAVESINGSPFQKIQNGSENLKDGNGDAKDEHLIRSKLELANSDIDAAVSHTSSKQSLSSSSYLVHDATEKEQNTNKQNKFDSQNDANGFSSYERKDAKVYAKDTRNLITESKIVRLENRMKMLERELREAAALEVGLYSVVAEHGSSTKKVHAPARRLSRLYLHACEENSKSRRRSAAKCAVSGLVLVAKACGNDVPRLTFWLSNLIVLRAIITKSFEGQHLSGSSSNDSRSAPHDTLDDWEERRTFTNALERVESWIFSRIIESIWWQTLTPHMQSGAARAIRRSTSSDLSYRRTSSSGEEDRVNFSMELWKKALKDACERICPVRAAGHECGCLPSLSRLIMEQCVARLDVAMFNALLRESSDDIPTDPVSDPISDVEVLPISTGKASFGAGAQLKNAIGNWCRWLTDLFGIDDDDSLGDDDCTANNTGDDREELDTSVKSFRLLNALSDLMMLPKDLLLSTTVRKEVCPLLGASIIRRVLNSFVPDEFFPDPITNVVLEALNSEDTWEDNEISVINFPCAAAPICYVPPSAANVPGIYGDVRDQSQRRRRRSGSLAVKKSYASDDELDELDSPLSCIVDGLDISPSSTKASWVPKENSTQNTVRYRLLREV